MAGWLALAWWPRQPPGPAPFPRMHLTLPDAGISGKAGRRRVTCPGACASGPACHQACGSCARAPSCWLSARPASIAVSTYEHALKRGRTTVPSRRGDGSRRVAGHPGPSPGLLRQDAAARSGGCFRCRWRSGDAPTALTGASCGTAPATGYWPCTLRARRSRALAGAQLEWSRVCWVLDCLAWRCVPLSGWRAGAAGGAALVRLSLQGFLLLRRRANPGRPGSDEVARTRSVRDMQSLEGRLRGVWGDEVPPRRGRLRPEGVGGAKKALPSGAPQRAEYPIAPTCAPSA